VIGDIPWDIGYRSEKFGLVSLDDSYVGLRVASEYLSWRSSNASTAACDCRLPPRSS